MKEIKRSEAYCGGCCWFRSEDTDGFGLCAKHLHDAETLTWRCDMLACKDYVSTEQHRHWLAVLIHHNLWRRDDYVPSHRRMDDPKEVGLAIDHAVDFIKVMENFE